MSKNFESCHKINEKRQQSPKERHGASREEGELGYSARNDPENIERVFLQYLDSRECECVCL